MLTIAIVALAASLPVIDYVRIESRWDGLGEASAETYTIVRRGDHYDRDDAVVSPDAITRFSDALAAKPVDRASALPSIVTREWLTSNVNDSHVAGSPVCSPEGKQLFERHLVDPSSALKALDHYFSLSWTDDYPSMSVDVTFHDRHRLHIESRAQHALMLPWSVGQAETWNPELPRAIAALMPAGVAPRLADRRLGYAVAEQVWFEISDELEDLEERCIHRNFFAAVERVFEIVRVYHGSSGWFTAYVRRADFPENLVLTLVIRDADTPAALAKLDRTTQRIGAYVDVVRTYVVGHPEKHFAFWCADGVSVDANDVHIFDDAKAARVKAVADRAVSLSDWDPASGYVQHPRYILPGGEVIDDD